MKIYTKTGDGGETGLVDGSRIRKDHARVAAFGDVDARRRRRSPPGASSISSAPSTRARRRCPR